MPTIPSVEVALLPAAFVRSRFGTRAASGVIASIQAPFCGNADDVPGANQSVEVGSSDAARGFEIRTVSLLFLWPVRSSLAASVRTTSSPARSAFAWLVSHIVTTAFILVEGVRACLLQPGHGSTQLPVPLEHRRVERLLANP